MHFSLRAITIRCDLRRMNLVIGNIWTQLRMMLHQFCIFDDIFKRLNWLILGTFEFINGYRFCGIFWIDSLLSKRMLLFNSKNSTKSISVQRKQHKSYGIQSKIIQIARNWRKNLKLIRTIKKIGIFVKKNSRICRNITIFKKKN